LRTPCAGGPKHRGGHELPERTVLDACLEVGRPVVFAVAIITIVYLPILSLTGIEGKMFKPMALTVVFALIGALILSLTYVPAAMTFILRGRVAETESFLIRFAKRWYVPSLAFVMRYRLQSLAVVTVIVLASFALFPFLGAEFIPRLEEGSLAIQIQRLPSVSLTRSIDITGQVYEGEQRFNLVIRLNEATSRDVETIKNLLVAAPRGARPALATGRCEVGRRTGANLTRGYAPPHRGRTQRSWPRHQQLRQRGAR
jgi:Cu/Ag efflux pump CusA